MKTDRSEPLVMRRYYGELPKAGGPGDMAVLHLDDKDPALYIWCCKGDHWVRVMFIMDMTPAKMLEWFRNLPQGIRPDWV
jgi:hypothetical protein